MQNSVLQENFFVTRQKIHAKLCILRKFICHEKNISMQNGVSRENSFLARNFTHAK
jgi:hypothetical protein